MRNLSRVLLKFPVTFVSISFLIVNPILRTSSYFNNSFFIQTRKMKESFAALSSQGGGDEQALQEARKNMVETTIATRGVKDKRVLNAMLKIPRHKFVTKEYRHLSYEDRYVIFVCFFNTTFMNYCISGRSPIPIGFGQTISQPFIVAFMAEAARIISTDKVLEVGTGCGYSAAVLASICRKLYTSEIIPQLGERAKQALSDFENVKVLGKKVLYCVIN